MKFSPWLWPLPFLILLISSCADSNSDLAGDPYGTGPFDSQGNYREEWADDPTKWRRPGSRKPAQVKEDAPFLAKNDQPPSHSIPLPPTRPSGQQTTVVAARPKPKPTGVSKPKPKPKPKPQPTRYVVKKGDSLYVIARRNKTSVAALQRANNIKGSLIRPGQRLVIPR